MIDVSIVSFDNSKKFEKYSRSRLQNSLMTACLSVKIPEGQASRIASLACDNVEKWLNDKQEVTVKDIINKAAKYLEKYHSDAAYFYEQKYIII